MRRAFVLLQWAVVAFLVLSLGRFFLRTDPPPDRDPASWRSWNGFHALSIEGVTDSDDPRYLSPAKLDELLGALRAAGYQTITAEDAADFLTTDSSLPEKAVLLLFEGGRKDHIVRATPRLIRHRAIGVLCVPGAVTRSWGRHYVSRSDLRRLARSPNWRLASMGYDALAPVRVDAAGTEGRFLSRRAYVRDREESDVQFEARIERDYEKAAGLLTDACGMTVAAYLYPHGDPGAAAGADPLAEIINRGAVRQFHRIAFTQEGRSFNDGFSDPHALSRLRLRGDWSGDELVRLLASWTPDERPVDGFEAEGRWQFRGPAEARARELFLDAGGSALLRGSGAWRDADVEAVAEMEPAALAHIYLRFAGPHSYIRVSMDASEVRLQEKRAGRLQTLAARAWPADGTNRHALAIRIKNNRVWVSVDGRPTLDSIPVSRPGDGGHLWIEAEHGAARWLSFRARTLPLRVLPGIGYAGLNEDERARATVLLPKWFSLDGPAVVSEAQQTELMLAAQAGLAMIPWIAVDRRLDADEARALAQRIAGAVNPLAVRMLVPRFAISGYQPEARRALHSVGFDLWYVMDGDAFTAELQRGLVPDRDERIVLDGSPARIREAIAAASAIMPLQRLIPAEERP